MRSRLQEASRLLIRASLALFTGVVLLLIQSAFWSNRVSAWMQAIIFATALLSYFRPHYGLLALAALAPLGQVGSRTLDSQMRGAEALVLAFLAGALVRGWTLREFRTFPSTRLHVVALIFGFVVAASCVEQLWLLQIQRDFPGPFAQELLTYASRSYIVTTRSFGMVLRAMLLLEGLALLVCTARYVRETPPFGERLAVTLVAGAIGTAILTVGSVATELAATGDVQANFVGFLTERRWSGHVADLNAAGSFFAMGTFIAMGMGFTTHKRRLGWLAATALLLIAMFLTGSRTAVAAVSVVGLLVLARLSLSYAKPVQRALIAATGVLILAGTVFLISRTIFGNATPSLALSIRWQFLETTASMLAAEPAFGVGIGQYTLWSGHFAPLELLKTLGPNNAHNNFAQIAGELGIAGLIAFVAVLVISLWHRGTTGPTSVVFVPVLLGLSAFILTWLGGHPLLIPEVAYPFWSALGVAAALVVPDSSSKATAGVVGVCAALLVVSIPFRVAEKSADIDLSRVSYGVSARQLMTSRARFFVPVGTSRVEFPLRSRTADDDEPVEIEVFIDGTATDAITLSDPNWRQAPINLPGGSSQRFHQIDLEIKPDTLEIVDPDRRSVEVGKWEIIAKPNG